jgi:N-acetylmuramoyl-L-alanine amidase
VKPRARILSSLLGAALLALSLAALAGGVEVRGARISAGADKTRLVVELSSPVGHRIFALEGPDRLVLDLTEARLAGKLPAPAGDDPLLAGLRSGVREASDLRIVLDLKRQARVKSFLLGPGEGEGHRLVIDLSPKSGGKSPDKQAAAGAPHLSVQSRPRAARRLVVAIDAGHGGEDPGAIGAKGAREKDVTLAIARRLAALVDKEPGLRPVMIRDGDYFVPLRQRILKARKHEADLFVSIHADAFTDPRVSGSSVFTLSQRGASSEAAKWLADKENSADLIGGVDLGASDDLLSAVLLDMAQNATLEHSGEAAQAVLSHLSRLGDTHKAEVQKAGFVVLKSPDIPSMLVETAFISNPAEERRLTNGTHQQRLAEAIMAGIRVYFQKYPPQGVRLAEASAETGGRRHTIAGGDTLVEIAKRYSVSLSSLRTANRLDGDSIRVGQVLTIPEGG